MMRRRDFLGSLAAAAAVAGMPRIARASSSTRTAPRYFISIFLGGGIDSLYSFDPKTAAMVSDRIWVPYKPTDIVTAGSVQLAPYAAHLAPFADRIAIVNSVETSTLAHEVGEVQANFMSRDYVDLRERSFTCEMGSVLAPDHALHEVRFGRPTLVTMRRRPAGRSISLEFDNLAQFRKLAKEKPTQFAQTIEQLQRRRKTTTEQAVREALDAALALLDAVVRLPPPTPIAPDFKTPYPELFAPGTGDDFDDASGWLHGITQEIAWLFEHDVAPAAWVDSQMNWDTHILNHPNQANEVTIIARVLAELMERFRTTKSVRGVPLIDEVAIVMNSDLGRFPYLNSFGKGKDHIPVMPMVFIGNGVRPGMYGATDKEMVGAPISMATGKPGPSPTLLSIEDAGATLRHWCGAPQPTWLRGRPFEFLF